MADDLGAWVIEGELGEGGRRKGNARGAATRSRVATLAIPILAGGGTMSEAAEAVGVHVGTLKRHLIADRALRQLLSDAIGTLARTAAQEGHRRIIAAIPVAVETLISVAADEGQDPHARVKAAMALLDRAGLHGRSEISLSHADLAGSLDDAALFTASKRAILVLEAHMRATGGVGVDGDGLEAPVPQLEGGAPTGGDGGEG